MLELYVWLVVHVWYVCNQMAFVCLMSCEICTMTCVLVEFILLMSACTKGG